MGKRFDKIFRRDKKVDNLPSQTYVFALNRSRFESWCHWKGVNPRDRNIHAISTGAYQSHQLQGIFIRPNDKVIVLENAVWGHGWFKAREDMLMRSGGWIDLEDRKEILT